MLSRHCETCGPIAHVWLPSTLGRLHHTPYSELIPDADDASMLDIHFEQVVAGTDRGDACIGACVDHIGRASATLGSGRIGKVAVDRESHPMRVRIAEPHIVDVPWRTDRDVKHVNERLPSHPVVDPDFCLVWPEPDPMLVELPGNARLSGDRGSPHDVAGGDIPDLEAIDPKDIAVEPRLGPIDRVRSPDAGKGTDLLEDRLGARVDHRNVRRALGLDVYAVARETVQTIVRSGRHMDPGELRTGRGIGDDHAVVCERFMTRDIEFAAIRGARQPIHIWLVQLVP